MTATRKALPVGRFSVSVVRAEMWVNEYLGSPAYEQFRAGSRNAPLEDADLLAPVLLNARPSLATYQWLQSRLPKLNEALREIPPQADLCDVAAPLDALEALFGVLDDTERPGARMAMLSKVLHRKRPGFIPLWDVGTRACYYGPDGPLRPVRGRSRGRFALTLASVVRDDLWTAEAAWRSVASPVLTPLRALDLVAGRLITRSPRIPRQEPRTGLRPSR